MTDYVCSYLSLRKLTICESLLPYQVSEPVRVYFFED